jgi:hypothetical protein
VKQILRCVAPAGFFIICLLYAPLFYAARKTVTPTEMLIAVGCAAFVFVPLHIGLAFEHRRGSSRQLPGIILVALITVLMALPIAYQYHFGPHDPQYHDPYSIAVALPIVVGYVCLLPLYGVSLLLAWLFRRLFGKAIAK